MIVALTTEETREMFLYIARQVLANQSLLVSLDEGIGSKAYGRELADGFNAILSNLSQQRPFHINDIFQNSGISMLSSTSGFSGILFGVFFLSGMRGMPVIKRLTAKELALIFAKSLQTLKAWEGVRTDAEIMLYAFEAAVLAFAHSAQEGDTLLQALQVGEISAKEVMEHVQHYQTGFDSAAGVRNKVVAYPDPGAATVWLILKSMREWVASLEKSSNGLN